MKEFFNTIIKSYSALVFSNKTISGVFVFLSSIVNPFVGLFGLLGNVFVNFFAKVLNVDKNYLSSGIFGVNGILVGLGIAFYIPNFFDAIFLLVLFSLLLTFVIIFLLNFFSKRNLVVMSLPFVFVFWIFILIQKNFYPTNFQITNFEFVNLFQFPDPIKIYFTSLGSFVFSKYILSGILISIAVLFSSRISFLILIGSGIVNSILLEFLFPHFISKELIILNAVLTSIALSFFIAPNLNGIIFAFLGNIVSLIFSLVFIFLLNKFELPLLVFSFNFSVLFLLYSIQSKIIYLQKLKIILIPFSILSNAENHLLWYKKNFGNKKKVEYFLPFFGTWFVLQGEFGKFTHKGTQSYAYDFVVLDNDGKQFSHLGIKLEDYYCFNLPVLCPADGKIISIKNDVEDNFPGVVNEKDNWGNFIIIENKEGEYTEISHFKKNSICVVVGQFVKRGDKIGLCGNSGYSPVPHIHIQRQKGNFLGAESLPIKFSNFEIQINGKFEKSKNGKIVDSTFVKSLEDVYIK